MSDHVTRIAIALSDIAEQQFLNSVPTDPVQSAFSWYNLLRRAAVLDDPQQIVHLLTLEEEIELRMPTLPLASSRYPRYSWFCLLRRAIILDDPSQLEVHVPSLTLGVCASMGTQSEP